MLCPQGQPLFSGAKFMNNKGLNSQGWTIAFLTPAVLLTLVFFLFPIIFLIVTSLTNWTGGTFNAVEFIGLQNFSFLFTNEDFWITMLNTAIWMLSAVILHIPLALVVALILFRKPPGWRAFRVIYFFPQIIAPLALAYMWIFIYNPNFGVINTLLETLGLGVLAQNWLGSPNTALASIIFSWMFNIGFFMVIFLSQLSAIPQELYESAGLDGASRFQQDWFISIPMLKTTMGVAILLALTNTFKAFALPFIMTAGGPGVSSQILPIMMYKQMIARRAGRANAIALIMIILGTVIVLAVVNAFKVRKED